MKKLLTALLALVALVLVAAIVAPQDFEIKKSITVNKPKSEVFSYLKLMENSRNWQPWSKMDPNIKMNIRGVDGTVGAISSWSGNREVGVGEEEIKEISSNERIDFELRFEKPIKTTNTAYFLTEDAGVNQTRVTWEMSGHTPVPFNLICLLMHSKVEKDVEKGLKDLKVILEKPRLGERLTKEIKSEAAATATKEEGSPTVTPAPATTTTPPVTTR